MKKILIILTLLVIGCSDDQVAISKEDYKKLTGDTIIPEFPIEIKDYGWSCTVNLLQIKTTSTFMLKHQVGTGE